MTIPAQLKVTANFWLRLLVFSVGVHGLFVVALTLADQLTYRGPIQAAEFDIPLLIGLGLTYLSTLLRRRKQTAWLVALLAYMFMLGVYSHRISLALDRHDGIEILTKLLLPALLVTLLLLFRHQFTVRSDIQSFAYSLRTTVLVLLVALVYGVVGFSALDRHDFHQEISIPAAIDRTIDQFGLTESQQLVPHTRRAKLFTNSLSVIGVGSLVYAALSLFQPIRARVTSGHNQRQQVRSLLDNFHGNSEDFFKLWPLDKSYHFAPNGQAGLAYRVQNRFALIIGDPFGDSTAYDDLIHSFEDLCYSNDWSPIWVHTTPMWYELYQRHGYNLQKIGEEASVSIEVFRTVTSRAKYFRQIANKFKRENYSIEILQPPHDTALIAQLQIISNDWLQRPGRSERGLMMGYFDAEYMQQCQLIVARDSAGTIQGFLNQIPSYDPAEANFDLLRHADGALGNINDYILSGFIEYLAARDSAQLNLGLSPLAGIDDLEEQSIISRAMRLLYSNGDRLYSFSGLQRFKSKYQPVWNDRYVAYKGNPTLFVRAMTALNRAMRK